MDRLPRVDIIGKTVREARKILSTILNLPSTSIVKEADLRFRVKKSEEDKGVYVDEDYVLGPDDILEIIKRTDYKYN